MLSPIGLTAALVIAALCGPSDPPSTPPAKSTPSTSPAAGDPIDRATANWLLNLARHQGHLVGRSNPRSASLHVLALLEAATEASPDCTEAYYWLYDLYHRMGRSDAARTALAAYATAAPDDEAAAIRLLEIDLDALQTAEARIDHLKAILARPKLPRIFESEAHRLLAKLHYERRDNQAAGKEIEKALQLNAMNVPARELAYEMFGETEPALQRVEMALQMIAINPSQANVVWDLAEFLDRLSLHHQAQEWYNRAILLHKRAKVGPVPAQFWHRLAVSYMSSGDLSKAKEAASNALEADPNLRVARLLRANVLTKLNEEAAAAQDRSPRLSGIATPTPPPNWLGITPSTSRTRTAP
jgi:tetratricopeptide (TPR) repeat protein